jgi:hypothetical protein
MKIWYGYGSEHSMDLVMIGRFKDVRAASGAKEALDRLTEQVRADERAGLIEIDQTTDRFTDGVLALLQEVHVHILTPGELAQFAYDFSATLDDTEIVLKTEESEVSAFLKVLLAKGARVEVYSAHQHPG